MLYRSRRIEGPGTGADVGIGAGAGRGARTNAGKDVEEINGRE